MFTEIINTLDLNKSETVCQKKLNDIRQRFGLKRVDFEEDFEFIEEVKFQEVQIISPETETIEQDHYIYTEEDVNEGHSQNENECETLSEQMQDPDEQKLNQEHLHVVEIQIPKFVELTNMENDSQISELGNEEWIREYDDDNEFMDIEGEEVYETLVDSSQPGTEGESQQYLEEVANDESIILQKTEDEKLFDFTCHVCELEFPKMLLLSKHCRTEHNCLPQVVCMCNKTLGTWKRLMIHKRKHLAEKTGFELVSNTLN